MFETKLLIIPAMYNFTTYKSLLFAIQQMEEEAEKQKRFKFFILLLSGLIVIALIFLYVWMTGTFKSLLSVDIIGVFLVPVFTYLYASYEDDCLQQRKSAIVASYINLIKNRGLMRNGNTISDEPITLSDIKENILELLK